MEPCINQANRSASSNSNFLKFFYLNFWLNLRGCKDDFISDK